MKKQARLLSPLPLIALGLSSALWTSGCSYNRRTRPEEVETFDISYGRTDLQQFASAMVASLEASERLNTYVPLGARADSRVKLYMGGVQNKTREHIDTSGIVDKIENALVSGGRFLVLANELGQVELDEQLRFQQESGRVSPDEARALGKQLGAEVVLYGSLRSIEKDRGRSVESIGSKAEDVYYQFNLKCSDLETAEVLWSHEVEISKFERISFFGRG